MSAHFLSCHGGSRRDALAEGSNDQDRTRIKRGTHAADSQPSSGKAGVETGRPIVADSQRDVFRWRQSVRATSPQLRMRDDRYGRTRSVSGPPLASIALRGFRST